MNAAQRLLIHARAVGFALFCALAITEDAGAQEQLGRFLAGGAVALGMHEGGHLVLDVAFGASPGVRKVSFGPLPFFAITHDALSPAREFAVSSAGFWVQHLSNEIILTRTPDLRSRRAPLLKGIVAFNVLASVAYAGAAFARIGPDERDTRGMAVSADIAEPIVGLFVLSPAALDALRYYRPGEVWIKWTSRAAKIAGVVLIVKAR
jgi:hypothetical protein